MDRRSLATLSFFFLSAGAIPFALSCHATKPAPHLENAVSTPPTQLLSRAASLSNTDLEPTTKEIKDGWREFGNFILIFNRNSHMQPDSPWRGAWATKRDLYLAGSEAPCRPDSIEAPFQLRKSSQMDAPCDGITDVVKYNSIASRYIAGQSRRDHTPLNTANDLLKLLHRSPNLEKVAFPVDSIIVKQLWEQVQDGVSTVSTWDPGHPSFDRLGNEYNNFYGPLKFWKTRFQVQLTNSLCDKSNYFHEGDRNMPASTNGAQSIPISCFVSYTDGTHRFVLVGLNIGHMTHSGWNWYAFSWTNNLSAFTQENYSASRGWYTLTRPAKPSQFPGNYYHYAMNLTNPRTEQADRVCFNPYLEALNGGGIVTNCIRCHQFAAFNGKIFPHGMDDDTGTSSKHLDPQYVDKRLINYLRTGGIWSLVTPY